MKNIDDILKQALTPTEKPDFWVNQNILSKAKEAHQMKQKKLKTMAAAALSAALILGIGSLTIYAARKFLLPEHIAEARTPSPSTKRKAMAGMTSRLWAWFPGSPSQNFWSPTEMKCMTTAPMPSWRLRNPICRQCPPLRTTPTAPFSRPR